MADVDALIQKQRDGYDISMICGRMMKICLILGICLVVAGMILQYTNNSALASVVIPIGIFVLGITPLLFLFALMFAWETQDIASELEAIDRKENQGVTPENIFVVEDVPRVKKTKSVLIHGIYRLVYLR